MYIDNHQDKQIQDIAKELGVSQAEVLRRAITYYLVKRDEERRQSNDKIIRQI
jgi:hypothetical protein